MASNPQESPSQEKLSPAVRKRLAQLFQYGTEKSKVSDFDYAHSMFAQCVVRDPSNLSYVDAMFDNLKLQYEGKKKKLRVKENRQPFKKAQQAQEWRNVLKQGPKLLKDNPWDVATLRGMASACEALQFNEVELRYLKMALDANPKDVDINIHCATSLARMGQFDQAIACWHRIEEVKKSEAKKHITELLLAKTRHAQGIIDDDDKHHAEATPNKATPNKATPSTSSTSPDQEESDGESTPQSPQEPQPPKRVSRTLARPPEPERPVTVEDLENAIAQQPEEIERYLALADFHDKAGRYRESEQVIRRALPVSGGQLYVQERLETAQLRRSKSYLASLESELQNSPSDKTKQAFERGQKQHNRLELDIYGARAERYPDDLAIQYEVGVRLKRNGNFEEAAKYLQRATADDRCHAAASLAAGECLQQMRQYTAAMQLYEQAAGAVTDPQSETYRLALYRAGVLATGLKDPARAKKWLKILVQAAPDYRDAAQRLDKLE